MQNNDELKVLALFPKSDPGWMGWQKIIKHLFECRAGWKVESYDNGSIPYTLEPDFSGIILTPLTAWCGTSIEPVGLELVRTLRCKGNWQFSPAFLVTETFLFRREMICPEAANYYGKLFKDQKDLNDSLRAVFHGELLFHLENGAISPSKTSDSPSNFLEINRMKEPSDVISFIKDVKGCLNAWHKAIPDEVIKKAREDFYGFFVTLIDWTKYLEIKHFIKPKRETEGQKLSDELTGLEPNLEEIDRWIYTTRNRDAVISGHHSIGKLFRQPISFYLWDFFQTYVNVRSYFSTKKRGGHNTQTVKYKFFLLDNRNFTVEESDGDNNKENKLIRIREILKDYGLHDVFEVTQRSPEGDKFVFDATKYQPDTHEKKDGSLVSCVVTKGCTPSIVLRCSLSTICGGNKNRNSQQIRELPESQKNDIKGQITFSVSLSQDDRHAGHACLVGPPEDMDDENISIDFSKYSLVLLDFFLSEDKQLLAHHFIRDYNYFKQKNNCFHTDWFFIVSIAYGDVLEYADAGALSSFSGTTRVDFGDNPLNPYRSIIFLYKLLQFLNSRIERVKTSWRKIKGLYVLPNSNEKDQVCMLFSADKNVCRKESCLESGLELIRQFQVSCEDEMAISSTNLYQEYEQKHDIAALLFLIINNFLWLPEADWAIVQRQIDLLDKKDSGYLFSCGYILEELKKRSNIY